MLKDKELRSKKKEIDEIEADWSSAQRDVMRSKLAISDSDADKRTNKEQASESVCRKWEKIQIPSSHLFCERCQ